MKLLNAYDNSTIWNAKSKVPATRDICAHHLIGQRTHEDPNALAVCEWDGKLLYEQLDMFSSRLESYLNSLGLDLRSSYLSTLRNRSGLLRPYSLF